MFALPRVIRRCGLDSRSSRLSAGALVFDDLPYCAGGTEWSSALSVLPVYREAHLQVRKRVRRRVALGRGSNAALVTAMNERWSLDFVHDCLESGLWIRTLNVVDDFTRECLAIEVDTSLSGVRVARVLDSIASVRGCPQTLVMDNGGTNGDRDGVLGPRSPSPITLHRSRKANPERLHRIIQRTLPG